MDPAARLNSTLKVASDAASMDRSAGVRAGDPEAFRNRHPTIPDRRRAITTPALRTFNERASCEIREDGRDDLGK
jgi:hypothetical protein